MRMLIFCVSFFSAVVVRADEIAVPTVHDHRLVLTLFASNPDIVTPIGIEVDKNGRVYVIESHTHQPKADYPGPKHDRVKVFEDTNSDGKPDRISVFADGFYHAMNLRFSPGGRLYLVERSAVHVLEDADGDGVSESRETVVELETTGIYPHDGLGGIAFSADGWMYLGLGENLGHAYTIHGTDGSSYSGGGEGGGIFRCRPDGSDMQFVATGFWNPFALEFDAAGRLFAVDNDPDERPPCRLIHVVEQGDYGYEFRYGRSGLHPFNAWNGELPGTLPMAAGTGEAPTGILNGRRAKLPVAYANDLLVTSWGDNRIERYRLRSFGASVRGQREVIVQGDEHFRPVGIAAGPDGTIYFTDWVLKDYSVHQNGRIWRLTTRKNVKTLPLSNPPAVPKPNPAARRMKKLLKAEAVENFSELRSALADKDPFIRSAAVTALARPIFRERIRKALTHTSAEVRLGALLALRKAGIADAPVVLKPALHDSDEQVRLLAVIWIGEQGLTSLAEALPTALSAGPVSPELFHAYLAAVQLLPKDPNKPRKFVMGVPGLSGQILIERILRDPSSSSALRAAGLAYLGNLDKEAILTLVLGFLRDKDPKLRLEAVRTLAESSHPSAWEALKSVAVDRRNPELLRAEAIVGLSRDLDVSWPTLVELVEDSSPVVRIEAVRGLRQASQQPTIREVLQKKARSLASAGAGASPLAEQVLFTLYPPQTETAGGTKTTRPTSDEQWIAVLKQSGDAASGRRMFFHPSVGCARCHRVFGRGGQIGPDLSTIARSADRDRLIHSVLNPSRDIAPRFVQYIVETTDGKTYSGLLAEQRADNSLTLILADAQRVNLPAETIKTVRPSKISLMPEELETGMTVQDFRDLLAFLLSLK